MCNRMTCKHSLEENDTSKSPSSLCCVHYRWVSRKRSTSQGVCFTRTICFTPQGPQQPTHLPRNRGWKCLFAHCNRQSTAIALRGETASSVAFNCISLIVGGTKDTVTYCLTFILSSLGCWNYSFMMRRVVPHYTAPPPPLPFFSPSLFRLQINFIMKWNLMNQPFLFWFLPYITTTSVIQKTPKLSFNNLTEPVSYLKYIYICTLYYNIRCKSVYFFSQDNFSFY